MNAVSVTGEHDPSALPPEEMQRAQLYALLAHLLARPPGGEFLAALEIGRAHV